MDWYILPELPPEVCGLLARRIDRRFRKEAYGTDRRGKASVDLQPDVLHGRIVIAAVDAIPVVLTDPHRVSLLIDVRFRRTAAHAAVLVLELRTEVDAVGAWRKCDDGRAHHPTAARHGGGKGRRSRGHDGRGGLWIARAAGDDYRNGTELEQRSKWHGRDAVQIPCDESAE